MNEENHLKINYESILQMSKTLGCRYTDLLAMNKHSDPFYVGVNKRKLLAEWFKGIWDQFGNPGMHLRRLHYKIIDQAKTPDSKPFYGRLYQNEKEDWNMLTAASANARHLGLVSYDDFVDRRNPPPKVEVEHPTEPLYRLTVLKGEATTVGENLYPEAYLEFNEMQLHPYHIEVWAEKSTMDDILVPLCEEYRVFLMTGAGFESLTHINDLIRRLQVFNKPCRIFYINDYDSAGQNMPKQLGTNLAFRIQEEELRERLDIRVEPIILLKEQVKQWQLPGAPDKKQTELDALEALHPGEFENIVRRYLSKYISPATIGKIEGKLNRTRWDWNQKMANVVEEEFDEELRELENQAIEVSRRIREATNQVEKPRVDLPTLPEIVEKEGWFFDSKRDYFEQLKQFKKFEIDQKPEATE